MKTLKCLIVFIGLFAFFLAGCSEKLQSPVSSDNSSANATLSLDKKGPVVHAVTGSAHLRYEGKHISCTITASEFADGSIDGTYLQNAQNALGGKDQKWNGDVLFLKVYENVGQFGGKMGVVGGIEKNGVNAGWYDVFFVIDNSPNEVNEASYYVMITPDRAQAEGFWNLGPDDLMTLLYGTLPVDNGHFTVY
jgi:hypothetical protein